MKTKFKSFIQAIVGHLGACMEPLMPAIIAGGLTKLVCIFINLVVESGTTREIFNMIGDAPFYFLPIMVAVTSADRFKVDRIYAVIAAGILIMPGFISLMSGTDGVYLFGIPVVKASYAYSILPVILLVWLTSKIDPLLRKICPKVLLDNLYPMVQLILMAVLGILVVGPAATLISNGIISGLGWLAEHAGYIAWPLLAGASFFFIMTGTGLVLDALAIAQIGATGIDTGIMAVFCILNLALFGGDLALMLRRRNTDLARKAWGAGITALLVGVAEPSVFTVCLKEKKVLWSVVIGSVVAGIFQGIVTINTYVFSFPGLCAVLMFYSPDRPNNLTYALISMAIAFVVTFVIAFFALGKAPKEEQPAS